MLEYFQNLFENDFMPHGHCYYWQPDVLWTNVISDFFIGLAYYSIPVTLLYFIRKRQDISYGWMFVMFAIFIIACGTTHLVDVVTVWNPIYRVEGIVKMLTAVASVATAVVLIPVVPKAIALPSQRTLQEINAKLQQEVNERKRAEEQLQEAHRKLSEKAHELEEFAYIVSHDLKAPLRGISTIADFITEDYSDQLDSMGRDQLDLLKSRSKRMRNLIDGVLAYSRISRVDEGVTEVNTHMILTQLIDDLSPSENQTFILKRHLPNVRYEEVKLRQVFQNLISNALKYNDKDSPVISIDYLDLGDEHQFSVTDNGPGIASQYHDRVFGMFQTLGSKEDVDSTGLGLALVKRIVEKHRGRVWIESEEGKGTSVCFTIPKNLQ